MTDSHLLLVDDQSEILAFLAESLEADGVHTTCARNGAEAFSLLEQRVRAGGAVAAIVSDWVMPGLDGLGLLTQVRASDEFRGLPFVLMSGIVTDEDLVGAAAHHDPDAFLLKPFTIEDLRATIDEAIAIRQRTMRSVPAGST